MKARKASGGNAGEPAEITPQRQYLRQALQQKHDEKQRDARFVEGANQFFDDVAFVPDDAILATQPEVGQKRPASAGSDALRMLFEGTDLSDEQLENMRNSDDYRELVKKFRDSDEWRRVLAGEAEADPMAEILVGASDPDHFNQMRSSGRYDELLSLVNPEPHTTTTVMEEEDLQDNAGVIETRPAWELWLIKHGYVPESVGLSGGRAATVGGADRDGFVAPALTEADGIEQEAIEFANLVLGDGDQCSFPSADADAPPAALVVEAADGAPSGYQRPQPLVKSNSSEQLLEMLRKQSLNSASDHQNVF